MAALLFLTYLNKCRIPVGAGRGSGDGGGVLAGRGGRGLGDGCDGVLAGRTSRRSEAGVTGPLPRALPPLVQERLDALRERPVEPAEKGFGSLRGRVSAASMAAARPPLTEAGLVFPLLTLRESALAGNLAAMAGYCAR